MGPSVGFLQSLCLLSDAAAGFLAPQAVWVQVGQGHQSSSAAPAVAVCPRG